jgi:hypothetical protein
MLATHMSEHTGLGRTTWKWLIPIALMIRAQRFSAIINDDKSNHKEEIT